MIAGFRAFFGIPGTLKAVAIAFFVGALAGGATGVWTTAKFYRAAEVSELKASLKAITADRDRQSKSAGNAQTRRQKLQAKRRNAQTELEQLRRSNATVDAYLSTPTPDELRQHHRRQENLDPR